MLRVYKRHLAALFLGLRRHMKGQRSLTGGFRSVDLHNAAPGQTAYAQRHVQGQGTGGDHVHLQIILVAKTHNGALAVHFFDLAHGRFNGPLPILRRCGTGHGGFLFCHTFFLPILIFYLNARFGPFYSL